MYVACKQCGGWFNAVLASAGAGIECVHCHTPIQRRSPSGAPVPLHGSYRDRAEFKTLLAVQQAVLDKRDTRDDAPMAPSGAFGLDLPTRLIRVSRSTG